ncbi:hypothetical protein [Streptomyces sp. NPDC048111]|uniref:hypothetical protein n=1 Tax=Streptomyces sp. NPDC048111 TaxID=3365500 RepID=UPI00371E5234
MHGPGHGPPPPRPAGAGQIVLRVLFALLPLLSIGMLAWVTALRLAIVTRRRTHWALFWVQLALFVVFFGFVMAAPDENDWRMNVGMLGLLALAVAATAHFLYADIRHATRPAAPPYGPPYGPYGPAGYGPPPLPATTAPQFGAYAHPHPYTHPYGETPAPGAPAAPMAPAATPPPAATPAPAAMPSRSPEPPGPHGVAAPRIDRVRAELDELSQYLRKGTEGGNG